MGHVLRAENAFVLIRGPGRPTVYSGRASGILRCVRCQTRYCNKTCQHKSLENQRVPRQLLDGDRAIRVGVDLMARDLRQI